MTVEVWKRQRGRFYWKSFTGPRVVNATVVSVGREDVTLQEFMSNARPFALNRDRLTRVEVFPDSPPAPKATPPPTKAKRPSAKPVESEGEEPIDLTPEELDRSRLAALLKVAAYDVLAGRHDDAAELIQLAQTLDPRLTQRVAVVEGVSWIYDPKRGWDAPEKAG